MYPNRRIWGSFTRVIFHSVALMIYSRIKYVECAPPDSLGIPIIKTLLQGSSAGLKELVQTHSDKLIPQLTTGGAPKSPQEINNLISQLSPNQRLDPVMTEMMSAYDRKYRDTTGSSLESLQFPDDIPNGRTASSTEENGIIWQDKTSRPRKRDRDYSKFSSRYRVNGTESPTTGPNVSSGYNNVNYTDHSSQSVIPFDHITDPNIRNHRLYDWEFETYKNFTHIDRIEDLMADEDHATESKVSVVTALPPMNHEQNLHSESSGKKGESIIPSGWASKSNGSKSKRLQVKGMPHIVISLEDTSENGFDHGAVHAPGYNIKLPMDSGEPSVQRPREPLRHSSTENIVYVHSSAEEGRYPYGSSRDPTAHDPDFHYPDRSLTSASRFRPSQSDMSDAVFIDPEEEFFTSTVRNGESGQQHQEISSETLPKRRRKKLRKITKQEEHEDLAHSGRFSNRNGDRYLDESDRAEHGIHYTPGYTRNAMVGNMQEEYPRSQTPVYGNIHQPSGSGSHLPIKPSRYAGPVETTRMKSDRILYPGGVHEDYTMSQGQPNIANYEQFDQGNHHHDGGIGNYHSVHSDPGPHPAAVLVNEANQFQHPYKNHEVTSTEYLGSGNRIQNALSALNIFGNKQQTKKLQPSVADQVIAPGNIEDFYHPYAAQEDQVNQFYEDSSYSSWSNSYFVLAVIIAFTAVFALLLPTFITSSRLGKKDHRHDLDEDDLNISGSSTNNYQYDNTQDDVGQHPDIWNEIKGAYNDLVSLFRGEYSLLSKTKKVPEGPKIVFREDEEQDETEEEEEDDEKVDNGRVTLRNKKRERFIKKQQQMLQKQQDQQKRLREAQKKGKKSLVSKTKVEAGRDNKDGKTINATSVNNLVVVSGSEPMASRIDDEHSSPRAVTGFVIPDNSSTLATMALPFNHTGTFGSLAGDFLREWAQVQLINNQ